MKVEISVPEVVSIFKEIFRFQIASILGTALTIEGLSHKAWSTNRLFHLPQPAFGALTVLSGILLGEWQIILSEGACRDFGVEAIL